MEVSNSITNSDGLIAKQNGKGLFLFALIPTIALIVILSEYKSLLEWYASNPWGAIFLMLFLGISAIYFWYNILDKGVKLIINKEGVWTRKHGLISWDTIEAYHFEKRSGKTVTYLFWLETKTIGRSMKLDITLLDTDFNNISKAMQQHSNGYELRYSGLNEYEY